MKTKHLYAVVFMLALPVCFNVTVAAQGVGGEKSLRGLKGIDIVIEDEEDFDAADGLSGKLIREEIAKKLAVAGIKVLTEEQDAPGDPYLQVDLTVWKETDGSALVSILLKLKQEVALERDPAIELSAVTWMDSQLLTTAPGQLSKLVREKLGLMVDKFVADYKEENQPATVPR